MRIAKRNFSCPECDAPLTGLTQKILLARAFRETKQGRERVFGHDCPSEETLWICERCDAEYFYSRKRGMVPTAEYEREIDAVDPWIMDALAERLG